MATQATGCREVAFTDSLGMAAVHVGLVVAIAELARLLDVPDPGIAISDVVARALALTTVFMVVRTLFILFARGGRLLFRRREADSRS